MSYPNIVLKMVQASPKPTILEGEDYDRIVIEYPVARETPAAGLAMWWLLTAAKDLHGALPKVEEYGGHGEGSADLKVMGDAQAVLLGWPEAPDAVKQELACWFYALGKVSRLISDYQQSRPGKPDTWMDLSVYAMMARRLQVEGRWP